MTMVIDDKILLANYQQAKDAARWRHFIEPRIMQSSEQDGFLWSLKVHLVGETKKEILDFVDDHAAMQAKGE